MSVTIRSMVICHILEICCKNTNRICMGLLPDMQNWGLRIHRECWECFPRHRLQRKPLVSDPGMHHGTCVAHVPWCMSGSLTHGGGENVPGFPNACTTRNFTYLARGSWRRWFLSLVQTTGKWFNIKKPPYEQIKPHWVDKTVLSHNGIPFVGKMTSLYWNRTKFPIFAHFLSPNIIYLKLRHGWIITSTTLHGM